MKKKMSLALEKQWFYTYLIISFIPLVLLICIYIPVEKFALKAINSINDVAFTQVNDVLDEHIKNIQKFSSNLLLDEDLVEAAGRSEIDIATQMRYYKLTGRVNKNAINYDIDMRYYIFLKNSSCVVTENGFLSAQNAFATNYNGYDISFEEWNNLIKQEDSMRLVRINSKMQLQNDMLVLFHSPLGADFTIAVPMNLYTIYEAFSNFSFSGSVFMLDENSDLIYFFNNGEEKVEYLSEVIKNSDKPIFTEFIQGKKYAVSNRNSAYGKYRYVILNSNWPGFEILILRIVLIIFLIAAVLLMLRLVSKVVRRHYRPIYKIMNQIENMSGERMEGVKKDGFTIEALNSAAAKLEKYSQRIENIEKEAKATLIKQQLLFESKSSLTEMGYKEYENGATVILIFPSCYEKFFKNETEEEKQSILHFMLNNVLSETFEKFSYMSAEINNIQTGIIAINYEKNEMNAVISEKLTFVKEFFESNFGIELIFSIGSYEKDVKMIHQSYMNAADALSYRIIYDDRFLFFSEDYKKRCDEFFYSSQTAQKLSNYVKTGSSEKAVRLVLDVLDENIIEKEISLKYFRYLLLHIFVTLSNCAENSLGAKDLEMFTIQSFSDYNNYIILKQNLEKQITYICDRILAQENSGSLLSKVSKCLESTYKDVNLNNAVIAEYCNLSTAYISVAFKKETGINLVDYIKMYRINKAKEYLTVTNLNIIQISSEVGFVNSDTFIRAFKKITGVTPGQWRNSTGKSEQ